MASSIESHPEKSGETDTVRMMIQLVSRMTHPPTAIHVGKERANGRGARGKLNSGDGLIIVQVQAELWLRPKARRRARDENDVCYQMKRRTVIRSVVDEWVMTRYAELKEQEKTRYHERGNETSCITDEA